MKGQTLVVYKSSMEINKAYSKENATLALQSLIQSWIDDNPSTRNITGLARESGVSESCVRRVLTNNALPTPENLMKLISFIKKGSTAGQIISSVSEDLASFLKFQLSYLQFQEVEKRVPLGALEENLKTFTHQVIFERSSMGAGISLEEIKTMYGEHGLAVMRELEEKNMIKVDGTFAKATTEIWSHNSSAELSKRYLSNAVESFYKTDSQINYIFFINESMSKVGYSKVMDVIEMAQENILKLAAAHPGDIPVTAGAFMDTMTFDNQFSKKEDVK